jgi:acyl-CoA hydrolase
MRNYKDEYKNKLRTADEAVQAVKSGDYISYGHFACRRSVWMKRWPNGLKN